MLGRLKDLEDKMMMITEIVKSAEDSNMKIHMLVELLDI